MFIEKTFKLFLCAILQEPEILSVKINIFLIFLFLIIHRKQPQYIELKIRILKLFYCIVDICNIVLQYSNKSKSHHFYCCIQALCIQYILHLQLDKEKLLKLKKKEKKTSQYTMNMLENTNSSPNTLQSFPENIQ